MYKRQFLIIIWEFLESAVSAIKKAPELISEGTWYIIGLILFTFFISIKSKFFFSFILIGNFKYFKRSSVWFLDFFALIIVFPFAFIPAKITLLLHWAEPFFSKYFIGFKFCEPFIVNGKLHLLWSLNEAPNLLSGSAILLKSLFDKLSSPIIFIG